MKNDVKLYSFLFLTLDTYCHGFTCPMWSIPKIEIFMLIDRKAFCGMFGKNISNIFFVQNVLGFIREGFCMMTIAFSVWEFFTKFSTAFSTGKLDIIEGNSREIVHRVILHSSHHQSDCLGNSFEITLLNGLLLTKYLIYI